MDRFQFWRYTLVGYVISAIPLLIFLQLVRIQIDPSIREKIGTEDKNSQWEVHRIEPPRGRIYDRREHVLASNRLVYEIGIDLTDVDDPESIAQACAKILGLDYKEVLAQASQKPSDTLRYVPLVFYAELEQYEQLSTLKDEFDRAYPNFNDPDYHSLNGLSFTPRYKRTYPEKTLASNILGYVNLDRVGVFGVEGYYDNLLSGKMQNIEISTIPNRAQLIPEIPDGMSLVLTIDREIQAKMEEIVDQSLKRYGGESATILVLNPKNGEILALATTPRLDLNEFWRLNDVFPPEVPFNRGISQPYEPGSVFKVLTMAVGLDSGAVKPETVYLDTGIFTIAGIQIFNWNQGAWGPQDMLGCLQHSLNTCLAWIGTQIGPNLFYEYMKSFGFGQLSGIDMQGEIAGRLKLPGDEDWFEADLATNSFGQGIAVTPMQMVAAISSIANDGKIFKPHIVQSIAGQDYQHPNDLTVSSTPIRAETAHLLTELLATSLEIEASDALVTGYRVAGKTGTGEIPTPTGYSSNQTNASFVGWGPVDDPQFLVYVWVEKPTSSIWGSEVAAPIFSQVVEELVVLLRLPPDDVRRQLMGN